jgi:multiple sugar transport system permease protein
MNKSSVIFLAVPGSLADEMEWGARLGARLAGTGGYITWEWVPDYPTFEHYVNLLFYTPPYLVLFWNSIKIVGLILLGQSLVGVPGAWAFAVYDFRGKKALFSLYVILMLLPFQVTMLSRYLVLDRIGMLDTHNAVILPAIFSTFPVFLIYRGFGAIPGEMYEVARIDGAGELSIFIRIGLPLAKDGITAAFVLGFLEYWNMMEEPMAFLRTKALWPLSLYLPEIGAQQAGQSFAASVIVLAVSLFVFGIFRDSLEKGIISSALKG